MNHEAWKQLSESGVTVFAPHPDDEVFGCGGLIAILAALKREIRVVIVSDGGYGDHGRDVAARKRESRTAATILGYAHIEFWDLPDQGLNREPALAERMRQHLDTFPASLVLAPSPWEIHPDHIAVCHAATQASSRSAVAPALWFYEVGVPMPRPFVIDISSVAERKQAAMNCFGSQLAVQDYARQIAGLNTYRGYTLPAFGAWGEAYFAPDPAQRNATGLDRLVGLSSERAPAEAQPDALITEWQSSLTELREANARLQREKAALLASTSWRLTAPLRWLVETGRRWLGR